MSRCVFISLSTFSLFQTYIRLSNSIIDGSINRRQILLTGVARVLSSSSSYPAWLFGGHRHQPLAISLWPARIFRPSLAGADLFHSSRYGSLARHHLVRAEPINAREWLLAPPHPRLQTHTRGAVLIKIPPLLDTCSRGPRACVSSRMSMPARLGKIYHFRPHPLRTSCAPRPCEQSYQLVDTHRRLVSARIECNATPDGRVTNVCRQDATFV